MFNYQWTMDCCGDYSDKQQRSIKGVSKTSLTASWNLV